MSLEILTYMMIVASHHHHGLKDDTFPYHVSKNIVDPKKLEMTCGSIANFTVRYLNEKGLKTRFILMLTLEEWNTYNNGHSMLEVWNGNQWTLWDIDLKNIFKKDGRQISAREMLDGDYEIERFSSGEIFSSEGKIICQSYGMDLESEEGLRKFYNRHSQVLMIRKDNGKFYFSCDHSHRKRVESYPYSGPFYYLPEDEFYRTFY